VLRRDVEFPMPILDGLRVIRHKRRPRDTGQGGTNQECAEKTDPLTQGVFLP
jgi:hypothetical protein